MMAAVEFSPYAVGLCYASVCSSLPAGQIAARLNLSNPTGLSSRWKLSTDEKFKGGEPNPCICEDFPVTHKHYLLTC